LRNALPSVDDPVAAHQEKVERLRRGSVWFAAVMLIAVMLGLMLGRLVNGDPPPLFLDLHLPGAATVVQAPAPRLLEVFAQPDDQRLALQLLLDHAVTYQRTNSNGAVSLYLPGVQMRAEPYQGLVQGVGRGLSWRVEARGTGVQVLLVGLAEQLQVDEHIEAVGAHWRLGLEVSLHSSPAVLALPVASDGPVPMVTGPAPPTTLSNSRATPR
jgi:MSHA biogenesis protein MshN